MHWYWKVRIHRYDGHYGIGQIQTERDLHEIDVRQDFYKQMTGCKMILEGMSETLMRDIPSIGETFASLWGL